MNHKIKLLAAMVGATLLAGCGADSRTNVKELPPPALTGQFVDSPVSGLSYSTETTPNGTTNANGEFSYFRGELVTFSIGEFTFPAVPASTVLTPLNFFDADTPFKQSVVNTVRLLQALDVDGNPENGIEISASAASAATMMLADGQTLAEFFDRPSDEFAADVEPWLANAGGAMSTLAPFDSALEHFVNYLATEYGTLFANTFDSTLINGTLFLPKLVGSEASLQTYNFAPSASSDLAGTYTNIANDVETTGTYEFVFGRRAIKLTSDTQSEYIIVRSFNTTNGVYSLCVVDGMQALASAVQTCDANEDEKDTLLVLDEDQAAVELAQLTEKANTIEPALSEAFDTDTATFFTSSYKRLTSDANSDAMYFKTGGNPALDPTLGQLTLAGARFTIGNASSSPAAQTSANDTVGTGIFNISEGFTISFDVIAHTGSGSLNLYVDNNTSSQGNSVHGAASKFYGKSINEENVPVGQRFSYTYVPGTDVTGLPADDPDAKILDASITNSFFQLRTDSSGNITIDNLVIETVADAVEPTDPVDPVDPVDPTEPEHAPQIALPFSADFIGVTADIFSTEYASLVDADGVDIPLFTRTGGSVSVIDTGLEISSGRFTIGNANPSVTTTSDDTSATGVYDLSRPYNVVMDIVSASDPDGDNNFQIYVDNNTSSSSASLNGSASKFYSEQISTLVPGTTLVVPGLVSTDHSFLQLRTESGGTVVINNLRIEYVSVGFKCADEPNLYYCDDFSADDTSNYQLISNLSNAEGPLGTFDYSSDDGNQILRYTADGRGGEIMLLTEAAMSNVPESGDYFVEARIRPRQNGTTANKQLFLMGRYQSEGNWYAGGLNVQNSSSSTQAEVAISTNGSISRPVQSKTPILLGERDGTDGVWYTTRFEMIGGDLTVYVDGEKFGTANDSSYTGKGLIGIFTNNRSFELDDLKVGDPSIKPIQLTLDYKSPTWDTSTTADPLVINITAIQNDGMTVDTFTVESSDSSVVSTSLDGTVLTLIPEAAGSASVTITSGSDANIVRTIDITVAEGFAMPTQLYGDLSGKVTPELASSSQYIDTTIRLTFDNTPTLGSLGEVRIFDASDDSLVDVITVGTEIDALGYAGQDRVRRLYTEQISLDGNTLVIKPHNATLQYGTTYYVVVGDDVVTGATLNGVDFVGLGDNSNWTFTTKASAPSGAIVTVDDDAVADFRTVQGALNYVMENVDKDSPAKISVKDGLYAEPLFLRNKNNLTIEGESQSGTIIQYANYESKNGGSGSSAAPDNGTPSGGRSLFLVESADMLTLKSLTIKNSHMRSNQYSNQAETMYFNSPHRLVIRDVALFSEQDTLLIKGYVWVYESLIAGNVDFIWGYPTVALFEDSEIRTIGDSKNGDPNTDTSGGYVLQARVPNETDIGFVFLNNRFTNGPGPLGNGVLDNSTYIARSGGSASYFDNVTLINNSFDTHIAAGGWAVQGVNSQPAPNPATATATSGWREYGSTDLAGNPLNLSNRDGAYILNDTEITNLSDRISIFSGYNNNQGWDPAAANDPIVGVILDDKGFAGHNFDLTGGANGMVVTVDNGADLIAALEEASDANMPITVYVDGRITDANSGGQNRSIDIKDMDNVSIIGVADRGEFDGIGISIRRANNIIIQNLKIHHVLTGGKDAISIEGDDDGSTTSNIWIDHNELYSTLSVDKDFYDGLIDSKSGAKNITISYNYLHNHWKASLHGHTEDDSGSSNTERLITFHHNRFENIESRLPLFRYGRGHLYNNYYNNITSTAINSRIGAELLIENNVFENTQNPIVSFYSDVIGYWNTRGNIYGTGVTWTSPSGNDVSAGPNVTPTSSYEVPYDYQLEDADVVKANVIALSGVGKLDQSGLNIPPLTGEPAPTDVSLPYSEDFNATDADAFFSADYKSLPADSSAPMHVITGGGSGISITDGAITLSSARFTIGNTAPDVTTAQGDTSSTGVFDLSREYKVVMDIVSVSDPDGDNNFIVYVDNNTSGSSNSMHGGSSKFYSEQITSLSPGTLEITGFVATENSFIQLRTESGGTVTVDNLRLEYLAPPAILEENFDDTSNDFFSADYRSLPDDSSSPMYVRTGGTVEQFEGGLRLSSGRFTIGQSAPDTDTADTDTSANGVLDLSQNYQIVMNIVSVSDPDGDNNFFIYADNNTSSSSKSMHGGSSKFYTAAITEMVPGELIIPGFVATDSSFLQLRTESGGIVVIDDLRIELID